MAEINIDAKIDTANAAKGLKEITKSLKDLVSAQSEVGAGTAEFKRLQDAINKTEGKLGDLKDAFGTLRGSGVERLTGSMSLLREGFTSADPGKLSIGMQGLRAAMAAIPIFLLIEGFKLIYENFDKLKNLGGALGGVFKTIGDTITFLINGFIKLGDAIGLTNFAATAAGEATVTSLQKQGIAVKERYEKEIKFAQAAGKEIGDLEVIKAKAIQANLLKQAEAIAHLGAINGGFTDDQKKQLDEIRKAYKDSEVEKTVALLSEGKKRNEEHKKQSDDRVKSEQDKEDKIRAAEEKGVKDRIALDRSAFDEKQKQDAEELKAEEDKENLIYALEEKSVSDRIALDRKEFNDKQSLAAQELSEKIKNEAAKFDASKRFSDGLQSLSDIAFIVRKANLTKGSKEEERIARQQFNVNKALQVANATIMGTQATLAAFASGVATPIIGPVTGAAFAIAAGVTAAANIAKIAATQFEGGGSSAPAIAEPTMPSVAGGDSGGTNTPNVSRSFNPTAIQTNPKDNRVWVLESDITKLQNKVRVNESRATFP